jgi:non-ribosomal peptide synthetase component F
VLVASIADRADAFGDDAKGDAEAVAYVIYTSGSTGKPKGVCVPHRAVVNFLDSMRREPGLAPGDRLLAVTTLSFDIAVLELLLPLSVGASVVLASREQAMDGRALVELIHSRSINVMQATPATWRVLIDAGWRGHRGFKALCGGESLPADLAAKLVPRCGSLSTYGPTETTVVDLRADHGCHCVTSVVRLRTRPCGYSMATEDPVRSACPARSRSAVKRDARLSRPGKNRRTLVVDPFASSDGARLYRTGDRGRWRNDGRIEHLGRLDFQVKVRGFRIELGDIEANLLRHADIARVVAVVREDRPGDQRLVAYLSLAEAATFEERAVRSHLRALLPDTDSPAFRLSRCDSIASNGKIDRAPALARTPSAAESHEGPQLVEAHRRSWNPRFHCLDRRAMTSSPSATLAARGALTTRLGREFALPCRSVCLRASDRCRARRCIGQRSHNRPIRGQAPSPLSDPTRAPLSLLQKRLWLFEQLNPGSVVYNTPSAHRLRGVLDEAAFERAFVELTSRQSILRTTIERDGGEVIQRIHEAGAVSLFPAEDLSALAPEERERVLKVRLDELTNVPIDSKHCRSIASTCSAWTARHVFFFMPHHIIWDGWSFDLFYTEFAELYSACREQREPVLERPRRAMRILRVAFELARRGRYTAQFTRERALEGTLERLGAPPPLPTDKPRGASRPRETEWISVPAELTARMRALGRSVDATLYMALLGAYYALLWRFVGGSNLVVGTPVRVRASADVENIMGLFTNLLPLPLDVDPDESFLALVARVKAVVMRGFASPEVQLEDLMREPGMRELAGTTHFYQAQFSYQDARQRRCNWGGLAQQQVLVFQRAASEDLAIWFLEHGQGMTGGVLYNADLFESETARLFASRYLALLDRVIVDPGQSIAALTSADATEQERVRAFAAAPRTVVESRIESVIEDLAESAPESPALRIDDRVVSRAQLEQRANRIAACLRARKVGSGTVVAICMKHGVDRVAGMLGTLKAGAIGLPLDPAEAVERLSARMQDVGARCCWRRERTIRTGRANEPCAERMPRLDFGLRPAMPCAGLVFHAVGATTPGAGSAFTHADLEILLSDIAHRLGLRAGQVLVGTAAAGTAMQAIECLLALGHGLEYAPASAAERMHGGTLSSRVASSQPACVFVSDEALPELALLAQSKTRVPCVVHVGDSLPADTLDRLRTVAHEVWFAGGAACALPFVSLGRMPEADSDLGSAVRPLVWPGLRLLDECDALVPVGSTGRIWMAGPRPFGAIAQTSARRMPGESDADRAWMPTALSGRWLADAASACRSGRARPMARRDEARAEPVPAGGPLILRRWLADLWQELLGVDAVDAQDNFFSAVIPACDDHGCSGRERSGVRLASETRQQQLGRLPRAVAGRRTACARHRACATVRLLFSALRPAS